MLFVIIGAVGIVGYFIADEIRLHRKHFGTWPPRYWYTH